MKNIFTLCLALLLFTGFSSVNAVAQVTKTVGTTGADYSTLKLAFDDINAGTLTGAITLQVIDNTTETASAVLNASGTGSSSYTSILIYPTISGLSISGDLATPLIDLAGADNVTINGSVNALNAAKDLTITNNSFSGTAGTSTIRFIDDATTNTVKFCVIKGSPATASSGILFFSTTSQANGNDNNTITNNDITCAADANRPYFALLSSGTALKLNSGNVISNNNIFNFLNRGVQSYGVGLFSNNTDWTISGNSFYETTSFTPTALTAASHYAIYAGSAVSSSFTITANYIGGSAPLCGGTALTKTAAFDNPFTGIYLSVASGTVSNIQGNVIKNIAWSNAGSSAFNAINVQSGSVNIGTSSPNTIGSATGTGSIIFTGGITGANFYGIQINSNLSVYAENNIIGGITVDNGVSLSGNFYGIYKTGTGATNINYNTIGSLVTPNSIQSTSTSTANIQFVFGINNAGTGATNIMGNTVANLHNAATSAGACVTNGILSTQGTNNILNNIVYNLSAANLNALTTYQVSVGGIVLNNVTAVSQTIAGNTIYNLSNTNPAFTGSVVGLFFNGSTTLNSISGNFIRSLSAEGSSSAAKLYGIQIGGGATIYSNNIISLGGNTSSTIYGIYETGAITNNNSFYYNTVYIGGAPTSGAFNSYGIFSAGTANTRIFINNILSNERANSGATGKHYAISLAAAAAANGINNNDYHAPGSGGVLGSYIGVDKTTLTDWQTSTTQDLASLAINPLFAIAGGTSPANYFPAAVLPAALGTGILGDYFETLRSATAPVMGALESSAPVNTVDVYNGAVLQGSYTNLRNAFNKINNGTHTGALRVELDASQVLSSTAQLNGSGEGSANYSSVYIYPGIAGISVTGSVPAPLIDLNGADSVTIDGRVDAIGTSKSLVINNTSTSGAANTSTIRFINDAVNNTIKYCVLKGAGTNTTSGIVFFGGTVGTTGNDNIVISNNDITCSSDATRPVNAVYSAGQATNGLENTGVFITANNIYDFLNRGIVSTGINVFARSLDWTISDNSFYETTAFAPTAVVEYNIITVRVGGTFTISGNYIGGSAPACGGIAWNKTGSNNNTFYAISFSPASVPTVATLCNIQGNTISNMSYANSSTALWNGIFLGGTNTQGGTVNIGTTSPNIIGAASGNGAITFTSGVSGGAFYGINSTTTVNYYYLNTNIQNNIIGSVTTVNSNATPGATNFYGIYKTVASSALFEINNFTNNIIGSTDPGTTNSINASSVSSAAAQSVYGIYTIGANNHTYNISGNTISKMTNASTSSGSLVNGITVSYVPTTPATTYTGGTNNITGNLITELSAYNSNTTNLSSPSLSGIVVNMRSTSTRLQTVNGNTISKLSSLHASAAVSIIGIAFSGTSVMSDISSNFIHSFFVNPANVASYYYGIRGNVGLANYNNNILNLGTDLLTGIFGFYITTATNNYNLYFNTVHLDGNVSSLATSSYAMFGTGTTNIRNIKNNIFDNVRINSGTATGKHYAAFIGAPSSGSVSCDYNDYYISGTGGVLGNYAGVDKLTLPIVTGQDVNSQAISPGFALAGGTDPLNYFPSVVLNGVSGTGILTDFYNYTRTLPEMGALEFGTCTNPTDGGTIASDQYNYGSFHPLLLTSSTLPTGQTGTLEYKWQSSVSPFSTWSDIAASNSITYDPGTITQTTRFRRLARVNCMADWTGAASSNVLEMSVFAYPVATASVVNNVTCYNGSDGSVTVNVAGGAPPITYSWNTTPPQTTQTISGLTAGTYTVTVTDAHGYTSSSPITVTQAPEFFAGLTGVNPACKNVTGNVYTTEAGMTAYTWTVSAGGTITAGGGSSDNTATITWTSTGAQWVKVNYTNGSGCTPATPTQFNVTVNDVPAPTITGLATVCAGTTGVTYTTETGMTGYSWTISAGGTITAGAGTDAITVTWNTAGAQTVSVNYTNANSCTAASATIKNVTVNALPVPTITGLATVCAGTTGVTYTTESGMTGYTWTISAGGTITAGAGTNVITVTWNTAGAQTVSVNYTNASSCTAASATIKNVTVNALPIPTITGLATVCAGTTGVTYTTETGMTGYTWTISAGGTITAGAATNAITVTWNTPGAQTVSVNYNNGNCTAASATIKNVTVNALPVPTITGLATVCAGTTGVTYTTETGMTGYTWTISAGGTITAGAGTNVITVTWNTAGAQTVSVNYTNASSCTAASATVKNVTVNPLPVPTISGSAAVCVGSAGLTYSTEAGMTGYTWTISAGGTITTGVGTNTITVTWNTAGAQNVYVNYVNSNGCTATTPTVKAVTVNPLPVPTITGASSVCSGTTGVVYTTETGMTGYAWTVSAGGTITAGAGTNAITVTWNTAGAQNVYVNYVNSNGCTATTPAVKAVTVNALPAPTITGPASVCASTTGNVYTTQSGMTGYTWTVSAGGTITAGAGTNSITVSWNTAGAQNVYVNYLNANGCTATTPSAYAVTVNARPGPTITGPANVCATTAGNVYTTQSGMTGYVWTISAGGTITAGAGTNAITVTWNSTGAQSVSVNYANASGCTASVPVTYTVNVLTLPVPTITGSNSMCAGSGYYTYTTEAGMSAYNWTVSAGGSIVYGAGTSQIQVAWNNPGAQTVSVSYTNPGGCLPAAPTVFNVTVNPLPGSAGAITGPAAVCGGSQGVSYSTTSITNALTYVWTLPAGATIASGAGTTSITVNFAANATSGNISVYGNNLCGNGNPSNLAVSVTSLPAAAGAITGPASVCKGAAGIIYTVGSIANATGYTWTVPSGATIVSGASTNTITVNFGASAVSGNVTVSGTNSCGAGAVSPAFAVSVNPVPAAPVVTSVGDTLRSSAASGNQWYFEGNPVAGATGQTHVATASGWYWSIVTVNGCSSDSSNHVYIIVTGLEETEGSRFVIYPVPNNGIFTASITLPYRETFSIMIFNTMGQKIHEVRNISIEHTYEHRFDLRSAPKGFYTVVFQGSNTRVIRKVLIGQ